MRLGILGGSFDPVHIGHLILAEEACDAFRLEKFLFIPAGRPPHKELSRGASDADRLAMLSLAASSDPRFAVDGRELEREGPSWTVETLEDIRRSMPDAGRPFLIIGDDLAEGFASWKDPERIADMASIVLARRSQEVAPSFPWPHVEIRNLLIPISSTLLRERIGQGASFRQLLPPGVEAYIREKALYGYRPGR